MGVGGVEVAEENTSTKEDGTIAEQVGREEKDGVKVEATEGMLEPTETKSMSQVKGKGKKRSWKEGYELGVDEPVGWVDPTLVVKEEPKVVDEAPAEQERPTALRQDDGKNTKGKAKAKPKGKGKRVRIQEPEKVTAAKVLQPSTKSTKTKSEPPPKKRRKLDVVSAPALSTSRYHTRSAASALAAILPGSPQSPSLSLLAPSSSPCPPSPATSDLDTHNSSDPDEEKSFFSLELPPSFALLPKARTRSRIFRAQLSSPEPLEPCPSTSARHISTHSTSHTHISTSSTGLSTHIPTHSPLNTHISTYPDSDSDFSPALVLRDLKLPRARHLARPRSILKFAPGRVNDDEDLDDDYAYIHPDPPSDVTEPDDNARTFGFRHVHELNERVNSSCPSRFGQSFVEDSGCGTAIGIFGHDGNGTSVHHNKDKDKGTGAAIIDSASPGPASVLGDACRTNGLRPVSYSSCLDTSFSSRPSPHINKALDSTFAPVPSLSQNPFDRLLSPLDIFAPAPAFSPAPALYLPDPVLSPSAISSTNILRTQDTIPFSYDMDSTRTRQTSNDFFPPASTAPALVSGSEPASTFVSSPSEWTLPASSPTEDVSMTIPDSPKTTSGGVTGIEDWVSGLQIHDNCGGYNINRDTNQMLDTDLDDSLLSLASLLSRATVSGSPTTTLYAEHAQTGTFPFLLSLLWRSND